MPTTSKGFRYPAGSDSPNIALFFQNLATDVSNYIYTGARFQKYVRTLGTGTDSYTSAAGLTGLLSGTWSNAPAGDYLIHSTLALQGTANIGGNLEVRVNGVAISEPNTRADVPTFILPVTNTHAYTHAAAGTLTATVLHGVSAAGTVTVYNASTRLILEYLGRRS